ncbi:molybdopterin-dependent oxidoreductase [Siccirubricoccus sp. G192]|uniref:molybdopterin-dependent oxidoreductase n=1 Tax=Siccirubricoccus sp. G192 TaxID=2849651 RepID=UPI001C2C74E1|nr:molybdopterin-dependent oxidoreductase [Siccirubricoccus sp. G192]MBV1799635.1 molybdopterin-dependent oxidoreductase [Siccirubricoccus sp. G192]
MTEIKPQASHWGYFDAVVEKGRVVGVRPFGPDPFPGSLIEAVPDVVHAPSRIDRPYIRQGWLEGRRRGHLRGGDPFVPVSWDRVTRLLAEEVRQTRALHGDTAIYAGSYGWASAGRYHHAKTQLQRFLGQGGGFTSSVNAYSYATAQALLPHILGTNEVVLGRMTDWQAIARHAKLMLCFGGLAAKNGLVLSGGMGRHDYLPLMRQAAAAGVRLVNISPFRGDTEPELGAEWVPIRPGSDAAMMLAMAHVLVEAGREDRSFLATHCTGWERLRAYILGEADGTPKTPAWAEGITGVPAATIRRLALECAEKPTMLTAAWSLQRAEYGEQPYWMLIALAAMLGTIGKPGQGVGFGYGSTNGMGAPRRDLPAVSGPGIRNPVGLYIPVARVTEMLERPGGVLQYNGRDIVLPDIRMIWWAGGNPFHHHQDLPRLQRAWARAETVVVQEPWWTAVARHADIVLPATTTLERNDIASSSRDRFIRAMHQAVPPQGQARNDVDMLADLAEELGYRDRFTEQRDEGAWLRHLYERWRQACAPLGFEAPDFDGFWKAGHIEVPPIEPGEEYTQFAEFAADPEEHPLDTPSGKVELFSETIASFRYDDCPGHPVWIEPREWLGGATQDHPLHLLTFQPVTRLHGQLDPGRVAAAGKIQGREPILMNPEDAAARGLAEGDIVRVFNARGACLGGLRLKPDMLRGVAAMATGAWYDPATAGDPDALCIHGNPNVLTADIGTSRLGQGPSAQSCLVQVERWEGPLPPVTVHAPPPVVAEGAA